MRTTVLTLACWLLAPAAIVVAENEVDLGTVTERAEMIPMRDGTRLSAYLYYPPGKGPWPVLFEQRYVDLRGEATRRAAAKLAEAGYVVALVNFRGTHLSEGTWVGYRALGWGELKDGYDTCEWLATQPWSSGRVGSFGSSQGGYAQNFLAVTQPPHLRCQYMVDTGLSLFHEGYRIGGTTRPRRFLTLEKNCRNPADNRRLLEEWDRHPNYDDYWQQEDCSRYFDKMNVPCFTIGSWYDFMNQGSIQSFQGRQHQGGPNSRGRQQLVIGPWLHGRLNKGNKVGDLTYPKHAVWPEHAHMIRWFNHWLKGEDNGVERETAVRYYVMGAAEDGRFSGGNFWRRAADWPPPSTPTALYLQSAGGLSSTHPNVDQSSTSYLSDPFHPMEILGTAFPGATDARRFEAQAEVRTFTTPPLEQPVEWTGRVRAELYVSSTARDTDFLVRVSDVYPDGRSILIIDYPQRARYREGFDHEALLEPGRVYKLAFDVGWISQVFYQGHRIRVTIASSGAPLYEPNSQTGGPQTKPIEFPKDAVQAKNTIHHSLKHASRIIAPLAIENPAAAANNPTIRLVESDPATGTSAAVLVDDLPLIHTAQLLPLDANGKIVKPGDAGAQLNDLLDELDGILRLAGSDPNRLVKLNIYVAREEIGELVPKALAARFRTEHRPAVSLVVTALPDRESLVALDAVAALPPDPLLTGTPLQPPGGIAEFAILPPGSRLYISGQAEPGTLREATKKTLDSLFATLKHCGRTNRDVVQLKCFLQPMQSVGEVREEIARAFGADRAPPVSFVEWRSNLPIEIELVAWGGPAKAEGGPDSEPLEFLTPPELKPSPLYSRVARIERGGTIYFSDLFGSPSANLDEQTKVPFERLRKLLAKSGSDLKHLAKATYYVTDDEVSQAHNAIRPKYYDPQRPPAASKAMIAGTGRSGIRYSMDMIAVPSSRGTPDSGPEHGHGLSADEAAAGWISLFDGATTFGWNDGRLEQGSLRAGISGMQFGNAELRAIVTSPGTLSVGGRAYAVSPEKPLVVDKIDAHEPIRLEGGVAVKSLVVRPFGLKPLFNGRDLAGWKTIERKGLSDGPSPFFRVEEGRLRVSGGPGAIEYLDEMFGDFVLQIDVRTRAVHSNGGVFIRSQPGQFMNGYEAQLHNRCLDDDPARPFRYTTGGIDDRQDARRLVGRDFSTFRMTVIADGPRIATWVNGVQVSDWTDDRPPHDNPRQGQRVQPGALQLQAHDPETDYEVLQVLVGAKK